MLYRTELIEQVRKFNKYKICVLGDLILDKYLYGKVDRLSAEAPVPVVDVTREEYTLGGAANAALNVHNLQTKVSLLGCVGNDAGGQKFCELLEHSNIDRQIIIKADKRVTTLKTRVISEQHHQQLVRIDQELRKPIDPETEAKILEAIKTEVEVADALLVSDYSKGFVTSNIAKNAVQTFKNKQKPVVVDSKAFNLKRFFGATVLTPNKKEAQESSGIRITDKGSLIKAGDKLLEETDSTAILITLGEDGCALFRKNTEPFFIKSFATEVFDVTGAGDTVAAVLTAALAAKLDFEDAIYIANVAAGITVRHFGGKAPNFQEVMEALSE